MKVGLKSLKFVYLYYLRPKQMEEQLKGRKGECKQCGKCCLDLGCPFLKNNLCGIYRWRKYIPIIREVCTLCPTKKYRTPIRDCGYYWDEDKD